MSRPLQKPPIREVGLTSKPRRGEGRPAFPFGRPPAPVNAYRVSAAAGGETHTKQTNPTKRPRCAPVGL
jgi:hypothetical protein